ncbi:hypothetical protein niasHT_027924 [Heterodera trifolii]|uniref:tRNA (uracil-O(2)-)-methyltransferase n=1 Tax=Heterodera trifolii TaxID=157864 RepID=A0ABD2JWT0_9BILA
MFSSEFEWKIIAETEFWLTQSSSCASVISQLAQIWWHFCASVNRRIACTRFVDRQNAPQELLDQIIANLSSIPTGFGAKLWRSPTVLQLIPKSHFHSTFNDRCFEVAEFGGDGQKEFAAVFRSAQLPSSDCESSAGGDHEMTMKVCEHGKRRPNPHISSTYAFHLAKATTTAPNLTAAADEHDGGPMFRGNKANLKLWCHSEMAPAQMDFLLKWLWPRLQKWAHKIANSSSTTSPFHHALPDICFLDRENRLLSDHKAYTDCYWRLKLNHGPQQRQTNVEEKQPLNFECCAVAAYLLELWRSSGIGPPKRGFVDLECGKGILAHILQTEGVPGVGIHQREKPQWAAFKGKGTRLLEMPLIRDISMADRIRSVVHDGADFLIGNRSDQIIPWIPLIAAKFRCNFFLLPNIPMNFHSNFGKRIVAKCEQHSPSGRLKQFYAFLERISKMLGFEVTTDQLKIPSKRRKCLIGVVSPNGLPKANELDKIIDHLFSMESNGGKQSKGRPDKQLNAKAMSTNECFVDLSRRIISHLISKGSDQKFCNWHCGGAATVKEIAKTVLNEQHRLFLSGIRRGLLTFLHSQRQLFVLSNGTVSLRFWHSDYQRFEKKIGREKLRTFQCLFHQNHPDGCPIGPEKCPFKHN